MIMDVDFKLLIVLALICIFLAFLVDAWFRERRLKRIEQKIEPKLESHIEPTLTVTTVEVADKPNSEASSQSPSQPLKDDYIVVSVFAKHGASFASYDLLQAISATGMQYGAMNIFHFFEDLPAGKLTLFSLASATEPGEFDLNKIGNLSCPGLIFFMNIAKVPNAHAAFDLMLQKAEQLADDLDGELCAGPNIPWSEQIYHHYDNKIKSLQT